MRQARRENLFKDCKSIGKLQWGCMVHTFIPRLTTRLPFEGTFSPPWSLSATFQPEQATPHAVPLEVTVENILTNFGPKNVSTVYKSWEFRTKTGAEPSLRVSTDKTADEIKQASLKRQQTLHRHQMPSKLHQTLSLLDRCPATHVARQRMIRQNDRK